METNPHITALIFSIKQTLYLTRSIIRARHIPITDQFPLLVELIRLQNQATDTLLLLERYLENPPRLK
jgi:hypothetical protein